MVVEFGYFLLLCDGVIDHVLPEHSPSFAGLNLVPSCGTLFLPLDRYK